MQLSQIPAKFAIPFANSAGGSFIRAIPQASQIGVNPGFASLTDGFPPLNFTPIASGGFPPFGQDMNGLMNQTTAWSRWQSAGGPVFYDATFQAACGGYPQYAVVRSLVNPNIFWESSVDNNLTNPDAGGANWISPSWAKGTGEMEFRAASVALPGRIVLNGTTVGKVSSGATQASDTYLFVYQYLWNNFSNTICPVSTGRGANALADWNANKTIRAFNMMGTTVAGVDAMMGGTALGVYTSVPVINGSGTLSGSFLGENLHLLGIGEIPAVGVNINSAGQNATHTHHFTVNQGANTSPVGGGYSGTGNISNVNTLTGFDTGNASNDHFHNVVGNISGGGLTHNNVQLIMTGVWFMHT